MEKIADYGNGIEIWRVGRDWLVYGARDSGDPVTCPSEGMAREIAGGTLADFLAV